METKESYANADVASGSAGAYQTAAIHERDARAAGRCRSLELNSDEVIAQARTRIGKRGLGNYAAVRYDNGVAMRES